jgi:serine/threonine protein phosphatase PrpC
MASDGVWATMGNDDIAQIVEAYYNPNMLKAHYFYGFEGVNPKDIANRIIKTARTRVGHREVPDDATCIVILLKHSVKSAKPERVNTSDPSQAL